MKLIDINVEIWEECAIQRSLWKEKMTTGAKRYEQAPFTKKGGEQAKKQLQMSLDANDDDACICEQYNKCCRSRIGLYSHMRTHLNYNI